MPAGPPGAELSRQRAPRAGSARPAARRRGGRRQSSGRSGRRCRASSRRQVLDVDAGAAVDLRRILPREELRPAAYAPTISPLPTTTMPPGETANCSRSSSGSTPIRAPGGDAHVLVDDRVAHDRAPADIDAVQAAPSPRPRSRSGPARRARGWSGARSARDDRAGAHHRVERLARAALLLEDELGRRQGVGPGVDRPLAVVEVEDRVDRDQVHVRVVVGVQRPDVPPVAVLALGLARHDVGGEVVDVRLARARPASG